MKLTPGEVTAALVKHGMKFVRIVFESLKSPIPISLGNYNLFSNVHIKSMLHHIFKYFVVTEILIRRRHRGRYDESS